MSDLIERQEAIDEANAWLLDCLKVNKQDRSCGLIRRLEDLPSVQLKRGKWIYHIDDLFPAESTMECNQCHAEQPLICDDEFCPHCGAKMEGTE